MLPIPIDTGGIIYINVDYYYQERRGRDAANANSYRCANMVLIIIMRGEAGMLPKSIFAGETIYTW